MHCGWDQYSAVGGNSRRFLRSTALPAENRRLRVRLQPRLRALPEQENAAEAVNMPFSPLRLGSGEFLFCRAGMKAEAGEYR